MARIMRFIGLAALATVAMPSMHFLGAPRVAFDKPDGGGGGGKSIDELAAEIKTSFEKQFGEVKAIAEDALGKVKAGEQLTAKNKETADEALTKLNKLLGLKEQV